MIIKNPELAKTVLSAYLPQIPQEAAPQPGATLKAKLGDGTEVRYEVKNLRVTRMKKDEEVPDIQMFLKEVGTPRRLDFWLKDVLSSKTTSFVRFPELPKLS